MVTPVMRFTSRAQKTSPSLAESISTKKKPKPSAAISARPAPRTMPLPSPSSGSSREANTTPVTARTIPVTWSTPGRSPVATPATTGITAAVAEMGATTDIEPTASPR